MKKIIFVIIAAVVLPKLALAELNSDIRVKLGSAPGAEKLELSGTTFDLDRNGGGNFQIEAVLSPVQADPVGFVFSAGLFGRSHKGNENFFTQTAVEYDAAGISLAGGVGIKASPAFHFEGKVDLDLGVGKPKLSSPTVVWNPTEDGGYAALSLIFGGYYTFGKPGLQLGLELGAQTWKGDFRIQNNIGQWTDASVNGSGGFANLVIGVRF